MDFKTYVHLIYLKGFFQSQDDFVKKLLKASVEQPAKISISESALKGYIGGDPIHTLADTLVSAGISQERISAYLQSLYDLRHKDTPTFIARYHGQTYQEALYEKIQKDKQSKKALREIAMENMAEILAKSFFDLIEAAANPVQMDKRRKQQKNGADEGNGHGQQLIQGVDESLLKLIRIGRMIAEYEKEKEITKMRIFRSPLRSELQSEFEHLRQLADAMLTSEESPMTSTSDQIAKLILCLTTDSFVLSEFEYRIITPQNEQLHQLLILVEGLKTESASQQ